MALKLPGQGASSSSPRVVSGGLNTGSSADLGDIYRAEPGYSAPSVALVGGSGSGKTYGVGALIRAGFNVLLLDVESKYQAIEKLRPLIISVDTPIKESSGKLRAATASEKYHRLQRFIERLGAGDFREHNGRPIDVIACDGIMEVGAVFKTHFLENVPISNKTGEQNTFRAYDMIGTKLIDFLAALKRAASGSGRAFGLPPLGIVVTVGEEFGDGEYSPILPGKQAPRQFPFQFEAILRLTVERDDAGTVTYVAHTVRSDTYGARWFAKAPHGVFPAQVVMPDLGMMYGSLVAHYRDNEASADTDASDAPVQGVD